MMKTAAVSKWYLWVIVALVIKGLMFYLFILEIGDINNQFIGVNGGDTDSYLKPIENFIASGEYVPDYRMPGYGFIYYLLRLIFNPSMACNVLIILQNITAALTVYVLALTSFRIFKSTRIFYMVYFSFLFSTYTSIFDTYLLTESFAVSASIFGLYFFIKGLEEEKPVSLLLSGLFFTWLIFLRPVYAPYLPEIVILILIFMKGQGINWKKKISQMFFLLLPFLIFDGIWVIRNYSFYKKILPLTKSVMYPDASETYYADMMYFLQSWGGSYIFWDPSSEIRWFGIRGPNKERPIMSDRDVYIPEYIYTSKFNSDSLKLVRSMIYESWSDSITTGQRNEISNALCIKFRNYTKSIKDEKPLLYHFTSRLIYLKKFLIHNGTYNLFSKPWIELNITNKAIKLFYSFMYIFILIFGFIGSIILMVRKSPSIYNFLPFITIYSIVIFPFIFRLPEIRYFAPAFPFMLVCSMFAANELMEKFKSNRQTAAKLNIQ